MTDEELIHRFETGTLPAGPFHHEQHIRLAWLLLGRYPLVAALEKISLGLQNMANVRGHPERYHQTITWAYAFLIHERRSITSREQTWQEFATTNSDLLQPHAHFLAGYYTEARLRSELARRIFLMPDRRENLQAASHVSGGSLGKQIADLR